MYENTLVFRVIKLYKMTIDRGDSMAVRERLNIQDVKEVLDGDVDRFKYRGNLIELTRQRTGFGYKTFFRCPLCSQRRTDLYSTGDSIYCRSCSPVSIYWGIQNTTRGGTLELYYRMLKIAYKNNIEFKPPFSYYNFLLKEPKQNVKEWRKAIKQLQILENMRFQTIFFQKRYDSKLIDYVINKCLYLYDLCEIEKYIIDWENVRKLDIARQNKIDLLKRRIALKES